MCDCVYYFYALKHMFFVGFAFLFALCVMKAQLGCICLGSVFSFTFARITQISVFRVLDI